MLASNPFLLLSVTMQLFFLHIALAIFWMGILSIFFSMHAFHSASVSDTKCQKAWLMPRCRPQMVVKWDESWKKWDAEHCSSFVTHPSLVSQLRSLYTESSVFSIGSPHPDPDTSHQDALEASGPGALLLLLFDFLLLHLPGVGQHPIVRPQLFLRKKKVAWCWQTSCHSWHVMSGEDQSNACQFNVLTWS